ncbi:MAG TPA: hypothetical protein VNF03_18900, partial [Patescibacteria group bacterium]|nr:hypothetical protein [Patescibacteria group bacterium]
MGLWEFLQQWRPSRVTVGVAASIFLHLAVVAIILWGGLIIPSREKVKKGDALIVELPKADEPAPAGTPGPPVAPPPPAAQLAPFRQARASARRPSAQARQEPARALA